MKFKSSSFSTVSKRKSEKESMLWQSCKIVQRLGLPAVCDVSEARGRPLSALARARVTPGPGGRAAPPPSLDRGSHAYGAGLDGAAGLLSGRDQRTRCSPRVPAARDRTTDRGANQQSTCHLDATRFRLSPHQTGETNSLRQRADGRGFWSRQAWLFLFLHLFRRLARVGGCVREAAASGRMAHAAVVALLAVAVILACLPPPAASSYRGGT